MNKTELKNFAVNARRELLKQVSLRASLFGITKNKGLTIEEHFGQLLINGNPYPTYMKSAFLSMQKQLEQKGYEQVIEEVAYTWFNRIIAIRYMEVHDYMPERVNVLSSSTGRVDPDVLTEYESMEIQADKTRVKELLNRGDTEGAYRLLFIAQCNTLNEILPFMFEKIQDYTELLLPDYLLDKESVINMLVNNNYLTGSFEEIEVIGWLYQYYITEEKDRVFKQKSKYIKEEIPYATQLFTPNWIVRYMVQNSVGRLWTEAHPEHEDIKAGWEYFLPHEEDENFRVKIAPYINKELKVEDIKCIDPAMGSGHILVYIFDVLYEIYTKCGYPEREIPRLILENNLYGLDIDDRAYQLASFSIVMKAMQYNKRFMKTIKRDGIVLNLAAIQETNDLPLEVIAYIAGEDNQEFEKLKFFFNQFFNAKTYGSLINIDEIEVSFLEKRLEELKTVPVQDLFQANNHLIALEILPKLIIQTKIMRKKYDVVIMNPPYMGSKSMNDDLSSFIRKYYYDSRSDLFAAFIEKGFKYAKKNGFNVLVTMQSWMFLPRFEDMRKKVLLNHTVDTLIHLDNSVMEISFWTCATVFRNNYIEKYHGKCHEVLAGDIVNGKPTIFPNNDNRSGILDISKLKKIESLPLAYWIPDKVTNLFESSATIEKVSETKKGILTGKDPKFVRFWYEVNFKDISRDVYNKEDYVTSNKKWFLQTNGGKYQRWYGNIETVVKLGNNGQEIKNTSKNYRLRDPDYYFKEGITWSEISNKGFTARYVPKGVVFGNMGPMAFPNENMLYILGFLNSSVCKYLLKILSPNLHFGPEQIKKIPVLLGDIKYIENLVKECIKIEKRNWDENETSIDFKLENLITNNELSIKENYIQYSEEKRKGIEQVLRNEKLIDVYFTELFNLRDVLIEENNFISESLALTPPKDYAIKILHYFIGWKLGRFINNEKLEQSTPYLTFTEKKYFENDIFEDFKVFINITFKKENMHKNLEWIADNIVRKTNESVEDRIRRYFIDEFYQEHCKMYQKAPIYWLVDSGKRKGLRTIIYMHRYQPDTIATIRFNHLQEMQAKYSNEIAAIDMRLVNPNLIATERRKLDKEKTVFKNRVEELVEFDKKLAVYANEQITLDFDSGVVENYAKFKSILKKIK